MKTVSWGQDYKTGVDWRRKLQTIVVEENTDVGIFVITVVQLTLDKVVVENESKSQVGSENIG